MSSQSRAAAKAAGRAVDVSADDFDDSIPGDEPDRNAPPVKKNKADAD